MDPAEKRIARRGLAIYFAVLIAGSAFLEWTILKSGKPIDELEGLILALMYVPAAASIIARLGLREGFTDVSFRLRGPGIARAALLGWAYPLVVGPVSYGIAWATGLAEFQRPLPAASHLYSAAAAPNLLTSLLETATLGTLVSCIATFGEELGWRGYMLTRLISAGVPQPILVSGFIWAIWHVPIILSGQYAAGSLPGLSAALFVLGVVAEAYLAAALRLRSGSIWPVVLMHGAWNAIIQGTFDRATVGMPLAVGESGWLTMTVAVGFIVVAVRKVIT